MVEGAADSAVEEEEWCSFAEGCRLGCDGYTLDKMKMSLT